MRAFPSAYGGRLARCAMVLTLACAAGVATAQNPSAGTAQEPYGWPWLVRALDRLKPDTDTRLPETPTQTAARLERLIDQGRTNEALREIEALQQRRASSQASGVDARLLFLQARALAAEGRLDAAGAIYQRMTDDFPELPEPWNNLAAVHAAQGQLDQARDALNMALRTDPDYGVARANLAEVYLMLAARTYRQAAQMGQPDAANMAARTQELLKGTSP